MNGKHGLVKKKRLCVWFSIKKKIVFVALPFIENPSTMPEFKIYFSKAWSDNLVVSLHK